MTTSYVTGLPPVQIEDLVLLYQHGGLDNAAVSEMITTAKRIYVSAHHSQAITKLKSKNKYKDGNFKTYVMVDGRRKEVVRKTQDELYEALYDFYKMQDDSNASVEDVFERLMQRKQNEFGRSYRTISEDRRYFSFVSDALKQKPLATVTESDLRTWLVKSYMPTRPKEAALRKMLQLLRQIFAFGMSQKLCFSNPAEYIKYDDYAKDCDHRKKSDEERAFSEKECAALRQDALEHIQNPRSVMRLFAMVTGVRAGELAALKWSDVSEEFVHIQRQQILDKSTGHQRFYDVEYTKDERKHPHGGRYIPRTSEINDVLELAKQLPGLSDYVFHGKNGRPVTKDSYGQNLRRACDKLGIDTRNNHAFRIAFNSQMIEKGLSPADRALILGHAVQTNEHHYSVSDKRRLEEIKQKLA